VSSVNSRTPEPHSPVGRVGPGLRVQWNAGSLRTGAAFFIPGDVVGLLMGWVRAL
jgi:hypothetical protein